MKFTTRRTITVMGFKVGEVEVTKEFLESGGGAERGGRSSSTFAINPDFMAPILAEAVKRSTSLAPDRFQFEDGHEIVVDGNIDSYTGTQELKKRLGFNGAVVTLFNLAALTNAYDKRNRGAGGVFSSHLSDILRENWQEQKVPSR